jgi:diguanylate cyclase (GGDEF)-like protein/PAS domain S-box-containing protein
MKNLRKHADVALVKGANEAEEIIFQVLRDSAPIGLIGLDRANNICYANASAHAMLGTQNLVGIPALSVVHPNNIASMVQSTNDFTTGPKIPVPTTFQMLHGSGNYVPLEMWVQRSFDSGPLSFVLALRDAKAEELYNRYTMSVHHQEPLETSMTLLMEFLDVKAPAADHAVLWGWDGNLFRHGASGSVPVDLLLQHQFVTHEVFTLGSRVDSPTVNDAIDCEWITKTLEPSDPLYSAIDNRPYLRADAVISYVHRAVNRTISCAVVSLSPYSAPIGIGSIIASEQTAHACEVAITHKENAERVLRESLSDPLTGLLNRRGLYASVTNDASHNSTETDSASNRTTSLVLLDLDGFKSINDHYGHLAGDDVLREIARRLLQLAGSNGVVARLGGDEFAMLVPQSNITQVAAALRDTVCEPIVSNGARMFVDTSYGIAQLDPGTEFETALRAADDLMYEQKKARRLADQRVR